MMAPSVTPSTVGGPNNPGLRLYKFETNTGQVRWGMTGALYILDNIVASPLRERSICASDGTDFKRDSEM